MSVEPSANTHGEICPSPNSLVIRTFDTPKYHIYICRGDRTNPLGYYVRIPKAGIGKLSIAIAKQKGETYIATLDEVSHRVNPYESVTIKQGRIILTERVQRAIGGDTQTIATGCAKGNQTFAQGETKSFIIYICGSALPSNYLAIARNGNGTISLPLKSYNQDKMHQYIALKGNIRCILTNKVLKVSLDGRTILKEKVLNWN